MSVEFKANHWDLLEAALKEMKLRYDYDDRTKTVTINRNDDWSQIVIELGAEKSQAKLRRELQPTLNKLKQQYSVQALKAVTTAKKKGWQLKFDTAKMKGQFVKTYM
jgi:hypothetical protein